MASPLCFSIRDTTDTVTRISIAPYSRRAMHILEYGGVERAFAMPSEFYRDCTPLTSLYNSNLKTHMTEDETEEEIVPEDIPQFDVKMKKNKIKTDEEIEIEYKHIIFGAKKRKGPRLGLGSPKKKKKKKSLRAPQELAPEGPSGGPLPRVERVGRIHDVIIGFVPARKSGAYQRCSLLLLMP